jgi:hypothetical protein
VIGVRNNDENSSFVMFELSMIAFSAWNLIPPGIFQVSHEFSNFARHRTSLLFNNAGFIEAEISIPPIDRLPDNHPVQELNLKNPGPLRAYAALIWAQLFQRVVDRRSFKPPNDRPVFSLGG